MRKSNKFLTLFLAVVFSFSMFQNVIFAANTDLTVNFGSANMTAANSSLKAYKIMNVTKTGDNYIYSSVNATIDSTINSALFGDDTISAPLYPAFQDEIASLNAEEVKAFAKEMAANTASLGTAVNGTVSGDKVVFKNLAKGYYLIVDDSATVEATTFPILVTFLAAEDNEMQINVKAVLPTINKEISKTEDGEYGEQVDASVGDDVYYQITGPVVPDEEILDNYEEYEYKIEDTLPDGVSIKDDNNDGIPDDLVVKVGDTVLDPDDYTVVPNENGSVDIVIDVKELVEEGKIDEGDEIKIAYSATVDTDAIDDLTGNPSDVTLEYNDDPTDPDSKKDVTSDPVRVYTFNLDVLKVDENGNSLTGAGFTLYADDKTTVVASEKMVDANGLASFDGLAAGTYYLRETTVPAGYKGIVDDIKIVISATGKVSAEGYDLSGTAQIGSNQATNLTAVDDLTMSATFENIPGQLLPSTGGMGTKIFTVVGLLMVVLAAALLLKKKQIKAEA